MYSNLFKKKEYGKIRAYYKWLIELTQDKYFVGPTNEWILDNYYLIREVYNRFSLIKRNYKFRGVLENCDQVKHMLNKILKRYHYEIDLSILEKEMNRYQKNYNYYFSYEEIDAVPYVLFSLLLKQINNIANEEKEKLKEFLLADELVEKLTNKHYKHHEKIEISTIFPSFLFLKKRPYYVYRLNERFQEIGFVFRHGFKDFNEVLEKNSIHIKDIIEKKHKQEIRNNIAITHVFVSLKKALELDSCALYKKASYIERELEFDSVYKNMSEETKTMYRDKIIKDSKEEMTDEYSYTHHLMIEALKKKKHIGFYLFYNKNYKPRRIFYVTFLLLFTTIVSYVLGRFLFKSSVVGFLLLFFLVSEIAVKCFQKFTSYFQRPSILPKMNYIEGLPSSCKTMMTIPTIVKSKEKMEKMFQKLEEFYLVNNTDHLYFTLLCDGSEESRKETDFDKEICEYGKSLCASLNKKYKKNIFFFVYRNRFYNTSMHSYLGYERKRGALTDLNRLLLKKYSKDQIKKYFRYENLSSFKEKIKYVITLDTDTDLVLNTALNLVGAMNHPLNHPVYNKEKTKIIEGYALIQPRISMDIESTNKSIYSQTFAGVGGFSVYNSTVSDFYQDYFHEGNFVGKGIYDLEVFDHILGNLFPENLILSHDLLEGLFLRCGKATDIEFIDDFPSSYQVDTTRQERWARGDTQILPYLKGKIKKGNTTIKNPLNLIEKFKIFDNIRRMFVYFAFVLVLLLNTLLSKNPYFTLLFLFFVLLTSSILSLLDSIHLRFVNGKKQKYKHHENVMYGKKATVLQNFISFITLPYTAYLYMKAFFTSIYRMLISKEKLLSWLTAEDAEKKTSNSLTSYFKKFFVNDIFVFALLILTILTDSSFLLPTLLLSLFFMSAPFVLNYVSTCKIEEKTLSEKKNEEIRILAKDTWKYFDTFLKEEYNYLIPDNYQENRKHSVDLKTSPTNIGFSLTAIVSAYELGFLSLNKALEKISKVIDTVEKLEKVAGHLYNWYDIKTLKVKMPFVISSVDSGNFVACLLVCREFTFKNKDIKLTERIDKLIQKTNFKMLYTDKNVFSVSYDTKEAKLSEYNYNKFASESRLLGYVAIALRQVPIKHWLSLDKTLTKYKNRKGLVSWSGTSFEYFMPFLFMKNYKNTLLDESYYFAYFCQKEYMNQIDTHMPFGISESAYASMDEEGNYKYRYFSTPYLKLQNDMHPRVVVSPYSSFMALELYPNTIYSNLEKFKKLNMYGKYGLYEAYDYDAKKKVEAYFAHHQGMLLVGLTNYLKQDVIKDYFHSNINMHAYEMLLKEKVNINAPIDLNMNAYKNYNFEREKVANDIRVVSTLNDTANFGVLSNGKYSLLINDRGDGFSRYKDIQINRYRKISNQDYGTYLYIRDLNTKKVWSNTYAPTYQTPDKYEVVFATDRIKFIREDDHLVTKTEMIVVKNHNAEIRKYTFQNNSDQVKNLELTSYQEVVLDKNIADINHRTFNNLFIHSEIDEENDALVVCRRNRETFKESYAFFRMLDLDTSLPSVFLSEREVFIKRGNDLRYPAYLYEKKTGIISKTQVGTNIDPIMAITRNVRIEPNEKKEIYFISGYARSKDEINDILKDLNEKHEVEEAFYYATLANNENTKLLHLEGYEMRTYNSMLNYIYQTSKVFINKDRVDLLSKNSLDQRGLWKFGLSGDLPILLVNIQDFSSLGFVKEILKSYLYFKNRSIFIDLVLLNSEQEEYSEIIKKEIDLELYRMRTLFAIDQLPGKIFVIDKKNVSREEEVLLNLVARIKFDTRWDTSLHESMKRIEQESEILDLNKEEYVFSYPSSIDPKKLQYFNGYGGFDKEGSQYVITSENTKTPWCHIVCNENFGTIMTNSMCGFSYAYNSSMYKISTWTNDIVVNDQTEGILINHKKLRPSISKYGFGFIEYLINTKEYILDIEVSVAKNELVKLYKLKIKNISGKKLPLDVSFFINPTLGAMSEKTNRYILSEVGKNYLSMRNVYTPYFSDKIVFLTSSEKIDSYEYNQVTKKEITSKIVVEKEESYEMSFALGVSDEGKNMVEYLATKYQDEKQVKKQIRLTKKSWEEKMSILKVSTPDTRFDFVMNGWYLYQTLTSRLQAKAGFYQVGGAFGFRDQLQDAMNICTIFPEITRKQILNNASHQFKKGDVLHWWHSINHFGLRSRYKDDYLWLLLATSEYLKITNDYSILDEKVSFVEARELNEKEVEAGMEYRHTEEKESLFSHLKLALDYSLDNLADNGLPLMGGGDWNDGMNRVGILGKGSSVWLGFFLYINLEKFISFTKDYDLNINVNKYEEAKEKLEKALDKCFEKEYYLRAFYDNGEKMGSMENDECKIDLISQAFAILSGISKEKTEKVYSSVEKYLVDLDLKIIKLLTPAFSGTKSPSPGYIAGYPEGIRENGGQYTHATAWYILALLKMGKTNKAYEYYQMINPIERSKTKEDADIYAIEPYVVSADIYSNKDKKARGGWSWYTGSAGWYYRVGLTEILGFKKRGNKLFIRPNNPFESYDITYRYLNSIYEIHVEKGKEKKIYVDNKQVEEIELIDDNKTHQISVIVKESL